MMKVDDKRPKTRDIYSVYKKTNDLNFSSELIQQECSKMNISSSMSIICMQNLHFWKSYEILYNFYLEYFFIF